MAYSHVENLDSPLNEAIFMYIFVNTSSVRYSECILSTTRLTHLQNTLFLYRLYSTWKPFVSSPFWRCSTIFSSGRSFQIFLLLLDFTGVTHEQDYTAIWFWKSRGGIESWAINQSIAGVPCICRIKRSSLNVLKRLLAKCFQKMHRRIMMVTADSNHLDRF